MVKKISKESMSISDEKISKLKKVIPEVFTEGKIDFEKLQRTLGKEINGRDEKYSFNWAGRKETFKNIQTTTKGTLKPAEKESVNFDKTENLFIEGDNLEVLKLLQKAYFNKIKMIYIDPPYNTGKDFVYKDNFKNNIQSYLEQTGQSNGDGIKLTTNPETNGRFHSDWVSMMYPRLFVARNLLKDDGVIFVSIDDNEVTNLRKIMDEVFGEENFVGQIMPIANPGGRDYNQIAVTHEYLLIYSKSDLLELNEIPKEVKFKFKDSKGGYDLRELRNRNPKFHSGNRPNLFYPFYVNPNIKNANGYCAVSLKKDKKYSIEVKPYNSEGKESVWRWGTKKAGENIVKDNVSESQIVAKQKNGGGWNIYEKNRKSTTKVKSVWDETEMRTENGTRLIRKMFGFTSFDHPKSLSLVKRTIQIGSNENDIILDFFSGSATTAHAVLEQNKEDNGKRKFICVQLPEPTDKKSESYKKGFKLISDIAKERIRRAIKQIEKEQKEKSKQKKLIKEKENNIDLGFKVFKLDKSSYKIWEKYEGKDEKELKKQLQLFKTPLISGYKDIDVIYECIIKEGYGLNSKIEKTNIKSNKVYKVTEGELSFYICLDQEIKNKTINELKLKKENMFICLDESLTDSKKKNLAIQCNLKTI